MMFLLKTAFWLAVVIMLIPVDDEVARQHQAALDAQPVGAFEAVGAAQTALDDVGGFCSRNPDTCAIGERIGTTFALKARSGALLVYGWLDGMVGGNGALPESDLATRGTLSDDDLSPAWTGTITPAEPRAPALPRAKEQGI